jgi:hypothetical protein
MSPSPIPRFPGLPDRLLEQYLCGELPAPEAARVEAAAQTQPELARYLDTRRREREAFLQRRPFSLVRGQLKPPPRRLSFLPRWGAVALAPALALGLVLLLPWRSEHGNEVRVRGGVTARLVVKRQSAFFELSPGVVLRPGDRLRIEVDDVEGGHLYVLGLSERGVVTPLHGFESTGGALRLEPGRQVLPGSMELDAAPEREALYLLLAPRPLEEEAVRRWLREATRDASFPPHPAAPGDSRFSVVELPKEAAP